MNRLPPLALVLLLSGCMEATDKYPSLALRPIETRSDAEPVVAPAVAAPDPTLDAQLASYDSAIAKNASDFTAAASRAESESKKPGALNVGSDAWIGAQAALAEIDTLRGDALGTVTDLEKLATDRGEAGTPPYPALDAIRAKAQAQLDTEIARIAAVKAALGEK